MSSGFSAGPQALGYLYQIRYALYLVLENREELQLSIESLDDVTFHDQGTPTELLQLKHHVSQASLTDRSRDLWKTLRVWSSLTKDGLVSSNTLLTLVTTGIAPENSVSSLLRHGTDRNPQLATQQLRSIAQITDTQSLVKEFEAFNALTDSEQEQLVNSIQIIDASPRINDVVPRIRQRIKFSVRREHLNSLYERLEGWWFSKVVNHLTEESTVPISGFEVHDKILDIAEQFKPDALPIDYFDLQPSEPPDIEADNRRFVMQLKAIAINNKRIEKAILDYYRAFEQRSRWAREDLLFSDETEQYEKKLIDEWDRYRLMLQDELILEDEDETAHQQFGRKLYNWVDQIADIRIRPQVAEEYVMRGSYHILADKISPIICWHPKFVERLAQLLPTS
ncbi:MAG: ABC-three component system protein [Elainellaceae cyanobacterium]